MAGVDIGKLQAGAGTRLPVQGQGHPLHLLLILGAVVGVGQGQFHLVPFPVLLGLEGEADAAAHLAAGDGFGQGLLVANIQYGEILQAVQGGHHIVGVDPAHILQEKVHSERFPRGRFPGIEAHIGNQKLGLGTVILDRDGEPRPGRFGGRRLAG